MKKIVYFLIFGLLIAVVSCKQKEKPVEVSVEKFNHDSIIANDSTLRKADSMAKAVQISAN